MTELKFIKNKTPAVHWDIFRLQLASNRHLIESFSSP